MEHTCSPTCSRGWGEKIACSQEVEAAVSCDQTTTLQPGKKEQGPITDQKKKKKNAIKPLPSRNSSFTQTHTSNFALQIHISSLGAVHFKGQVKKKGRWFEDRTPGLMTVSGICRICSGLFQIPYTDAVGPFAYLAGPPNTWTQNINKSNPEIHRKDNTLSPSNAYVKETRFFNIWKINQSNLPFQQNRG